MGNNQERSSWKRYLGLGLASAGGWLAWRGLMSEPMLPLPPALQAERRTFTLPGFGDLSYYRDESGEGVPLVLIHSINAAPSAFEMKPLFEQYRGKRPVYALDLPGFGFSSRANTVYSPLLYARAIGEFLRQVVQTSADVITLSLSAEFAARYSLEPEQLMRSLVMITPTGFRPSMPDVPEEALYGFFTFPLWSQALYSLVVSKPSIRYYSNQSFVDEAPDAFVDYAYATSHQPGARHAPFYFVSGQLFTKQVREVIYDKVSVPTVVLYDRDPNVSFEALPYFVNSHDNWQAERIAPSMGMVHWDHPLETATILDTFWAQQEHMHG